MGLFDSFKKKFEDVGSSKKVKHVVDEKKKKSAKKEKKADGLTSEQIAAAQALEKQESSKKTDSGESKKQKKDVVKNPRDTKYAFRILLKPLVTEKSAYLTSERTYMFAVHPDATKNEIAKAVHAAYDVKPVSVRLVNKQGKEITYGRVSGKTRKTRKAFVTLPEGKTIDIYQN